MEELKGQHAILRECIEQLTALESSRANLVSNLREALQEQVCFLSTSLHILHCEFGLFAS